MNDSTVAISFMQQCCKRMPKIINMKSVRECLKSLRQEPPQGNPCGPPPPSGSPSGPLPTGSPSGPPPPPQGTHPPGAGGEEEFGESDVEEPVETPGEGDARNSSKSGKIQHRPGDKACKGMCLAVTSFDIPYLLKYKTSPAASCSPQSLIGRTVDT
jgi:U5 snRNP spliceosome subunit